MDESSLGPDLNFAELAVLAAVIETDGACLDDLTLTAEDFYEPRHGDIYARMLLDHLNGKHVTAATVMDAFPEHAVLVAGLSEYGRLRYALDDHAAIVARAALRRRLEAAAAGIVQRVHDRGLEEKDLAEQARALVDGAVGEHRARVRFLRDFMPSMVERLGDDAAKGSLFYPSPWPSLDQVIGGFRPGCVYVIAARPSQGKSVVAQQIAGALARYGVVAFSSLEMDGDELMGRFIAERAGINVGRVKDGTLSQSDWERLAWRRRAIDDLNVAIDDRPDVTVADVRAHARTVSRHGRLSGVVVDYLQLLKPMNSRAERHVQVSESSRLLKVMAKDLHCPVIALSQLNRDSENRADKRPRLAEMKESGSIEQDADVAILLSREPRLAGQCLVLDVAKNRHGEQNVVELKWEGALSRAVEWPDESSEGQGQ